MDQTFEASSITTISSTNMETLVNSSAKVSSHWMMKEKRMPSANWWLASWERRAGDEPWAFSWEPNEGYLKRHQDWKCWNPFEDPIQAKEQKGLELHKIGVNTVDLAKAAELHINRVAKIKNWRWMLNRGTPATNLIKYYMTKITKWLWMSSRI